MKRYRLTPEGERYLKEGLPEKQLMKMLGSGKQLADLRHLKGLNIALQWAKKHGWISIEKGKVIPRGSAHSIPEEEALRKISEGSSVAAKLLKTLEQRKLVVQVREDVQKQASKQLDSGVLTPELIKSGLWKQARFKGYNVTVTGQKMFPGKRQPYLQFLYLARRKLIELGFHEIRGESIVQEFWNFDALFQAQDHPSRDWTETYVLKDPKKGKLPDPSLVKRVKTTHENGWTTGSTGWGYRWDPEKAARLMPIAHDTAISPKILSSKELQVPGKYFQIVRCFRPDVLDATHLIEFNQVGGFVVGESLTFRSLLGVLEMFAKEIAGASKVKFFPDYYPFTEPSVQLSAKHPELGWVEFGGAGMFREEMMLPLGVKEPAIAWGIGIDRLAMFKLGIKDIRELFSTNLGWLREKEVVI